MDRTSFYAWKKRYEERGIDGLKDEPPVHKTHPQTTPRAMRKRIETIALQHPSYGCNRIAAELAKTTHTVSAVTIQNIMSSAGLGKRHDRWLLLENLYQAAPAKVTSEQTSFLAQMNPCFRERCMRPAQPGDLLACSVFSLGNVKPIGRIWLHVAVDVFSNFACVIMAQSQTPDNAAYALLDLARSLSWKFGFYPRQIITNNSRPFLEPAPYGLRYHLYMKGITHEIVSLPGWMNGSVERFRRAVIKDFLVMNCRQRQTFDALNAAFRSWLIAYNEEQPLLGFPNYGHPPVALIKQAVSREDLEIELIG